MSIPAIPPLTPTAERADTEIDQPDFAVHSQVSTPRAQTTEPFAVRGVKSPLIGRQREIEQILEVITSAQDFAAPQLVSIIGNQGTGKTRLLHELAEKVPAPNRVYRGRATADGPPYSALRSLLCDRFGIVEGDAEDRVRSEFIREVEKAFGDKRVAEVLHFLGEFVDLRFPESPFVRVLGENPAQHDEIARTVLRRFMEVDARKSPLILMLDDLHHADDDTLSLLDDLGEALGGSSVVLVVAARPELALRFSDWGGAGSDHLRIDLRNLEPEPAAEMLRHLLVKCDEVPVEIVEEAVEMTGGNPHFLEQLVRLFLANGTIDASAEPWKLDREKAAETELPISVEEAIEARIAALNHDERDVLEKAAVFGSVFWVGAVVAMSRLQKTAQTENRRPLDYDWTDSNEPVRRRVLEVLEALVERDYVLKLPESDSTIAGDVEYVFKHNLERELITKSTEGKKLMLYPRLAAQWLESKLTSRSEEQLEFLAQLYDRGRDSRRAALCYLAGADKAYARYAHEQAVDLYKKALTVLDPDEAVAHMSALHNLGAVLDTLGRTEEAEQHFTAMLHRAWLLDHPAKAGAAYSRLGRVYRRVGKYDRAMDHLVAAHALFKRAEDRRGVAGTLDDMGRIHWIRGTFGKALEFHRKALALRREIGEERSIALSLANLGRVHCDSGDARAANEHFREALELRKQIGDLSGVVSSLCDLGGVETTEGHYTSALVMFHEASRIANEIGEKVAQTEVLLKLGECKHALGRSPEAIEHLQEAIALASQLGNRLALSHGYCKLAEVHLGMGEVVQAKDEVMRGLVVATELGSLAKEGYAHRVLGEILSFEGASAEAEQHYQMSLQILTELRSPSELARTYRAYAGFQERMGRAHEARKLRQKADELVAAPRPS